MSDQTIELNCWVVGEILKREKVGILKQVIKAKKQSSFQDTTADSLVLWKISHHRWAVPPLAARHQPL
jgi:hypothetical protein